MLLPLADRCSRTGVIPTLRSVALIRAVGPRIETALATNLLACGPYYGVVESFTPVRENRRSGEAQRKKHQSFSHFALLSNR